MFLPLGLKIYHIIKIIKTDNSGLLQKKNKYYLGKRAGVLENGENFTSKGTTALLFPLGTVNLIPSHFKNHVNATGRVISGRSIGGDDIIHLRSSVQQLNEFTKAFIKRHPSELVFFFFQKKY